MDAMQEAPWVVTFDPKDTLEEKLKKAAHVKPSPAQLNWMEKEFIGFVHYSPNTFNHVQWGNGTEKKSDYHPAKLDVPQWCRVCSRAGMKMMIFTAKHHDGFCQWNTKTTDFSSETILGGEDVMESLQKGCEDNEMGLGVYLSPWDMHQRGKGLWPKPEYNQYFLAQLRELLTNYGRVDEVWFDGACSDFEIWKPVPAYAPREWYKLIEQLQPGAVVRLYDPHELAAPETWALVKAGKQKLCWAGKGVRWVGNEGGASRENEWSVQPVFSREIAENATWKDLGEEKYYENAVGAIWYPLEVNTVLLNQWFWNEKTSSVRKLSDLIEVYYNSIGNNGVLLLNVSPDTQGIIRQDQEERLLQMRAYLEETFCVNLAGNAAVVCTAEAKGHEAVKVLDGEKLTYWTSPGEWSLGDSTASLTFDLGGEKTFDQVMVQEFIEEGQRVADWRLEVWMDQEWVEVVRHKTIGYKTVRRFDPVTASKVRFQILRSWDTPMIRSFGLYQSAPLPKEQEDISIELDLEPESIEERALSDGLHFCCYDSGMQSAALLDSMVGAKEAQGGSVFAVKEINNGTAAVVREEYGDKKIGFSLSFEGYLRVPADGSYLFQLENTDGGQLYLCGNLVVNNDEPHEQKAETRSVDLKKGYYPVKVLYTSFRHPGSLRLCWKRPGHDLSEISSKYFFHKV